MSREERLHYPAQDHHLPAAAALLAPTEQCLPSYTPPSHSIPPPITTQTTYPPPLPHFPRDNTPLQPPPSHQPPLQQLAPPPPQPSPTPNPNGFSTLVTGLVEHPLLALLMRRVLEASNSTIEPLSDPHPSEAEGRAAMVQRYAENHGLDRAGQRWSNVDVFMTALLSAMTQVSRGCGDGHVRRLISRARCKGRVQRSVGRTALSEGAKSKLERWFQDHFEDPYPNEQQKIMLARVCGMTLASVNNWFGNKRMRTKRQRLGAGAKVLAPRSKWQAIVMKNGEGRRLGGWEEERERGRVVREFQVGFGQGQQRLDSFQGFGS